MLHPPLAGPKSKEGSCWAAHTQAASKAKPPQDTTQADSPGPEGIPCPSSFHGTSAQARVFTLAHKMALTEKLCSLFFPLSLPLSPGSPLAPDRFREGLPPTENTTSFPHRAESPSSPAPKVPNQLDPAGFIREAEHEAYSFFSVTRV